VESLGHGFPRLPSQAGDVSSRARETAHEYRTNGSEGVTITIGTVLVAAWAASIAGLCQGGSCSSQEPDGNGDNPQSELALPWVEVTTTGDRATTGSEARPHITGRRVPGVSEVRSLRSAA
jgi:hypothetical protein